MTTKSQGPYNDAVNHVSKHGPVPVEFIDFGGKNSTGQRAMVEAVFDREVRRHGGIGFTDQLLTDLGWTGTEQSVYVTMVPEHEQKLDMPL